MTFEGPGRPAGVPALYSPVPPAASEPGAAGATFTPRGSTMKYHYLVQLGTDHADEVDGPGSEMAAIAQLKAELLVALTDLKNLTTPAPKVAPGRKVSELRTFFEDK